MSPQEQNLQLTYFSSKIENLQTYHNHKEVMVNAGFLLQLTLFATIIMEEIWPPKWIAGDSLLSQLSTALVYFLFWMLVHGFISWQLKNKIIAGLYINGYELALKRLVFEKLSGRDLQQEAELGDKKESGFFIRFLGHIIPLKRQTLRYDINVKGLPRYIAIAINESMEKGTAAKGHERLMIFGSLIMLGLTILRMCFHTPVV